MENVRIKSHGIVHTSTWNPSVMGWRLGGGVDGVRGWGFTPGTPVERGVSVCVFHTPTPTSSRRCNIQ